MDTSTTGDEVIEEDGMHYRFGGGALWEMLHRRYNQIHNSPNKNLMFIEITLLQVMNTKHKSGIPGYLKYQDRGYMYFPHKVFIPFLQLVDVSVKQVINLISFSEHGSNLNKVRPFTTSAMELVDNSHF